MVATGVVLVAIAWMYAGVAKGLVAEWLSSPDASYGLLLVAIAAFVVVDRRSRVASEVDPSDRPWIGAALLALGSMMYAVGQLGADVFITRLSLPVVIGGAVAVLAGVRVLRTVAAPLVFVAIAIPLPALLVNAITLPLQLVASRIAEATLTAASVPVYRDGNVLTLPSTVLEVAEACSGLRSLVSLVAVATMIAWLTPTAIGRRLAIVLAAIPIAIVMNGLRVAATGLACEVFSPKAATGGWHTFTGWVTFVLSLGLLTVVARPFSAGVRPTLKRPATLDLAA